ncbi:MAG: hypothetical protein QM669_14145, partial [Siphonobacter sp.]
MKRIIVFILVLVCSVSAWAQAPIGSRQKAFNITLADGQASSETTTYTNFYKKLEVFFKGRKDLPKVEGLLKQVEPYLNKPLSKEDQSRLKKVLKDIEDLTERDAKSG